MPSNKFNEAQNSQSSLEFLKAASYYYGKAKSLAACQFILAVPGALAASLIVAAYSDAKAWAVLYSIIVALADTLWLDRWQNRLKALGAKAQEEFDTMLFNIPWRSLQAGQRLQPEDIAMANRRFHGSDSNLKNWYPSDAGSLDCPFNALACQRINVWWDSVIRRKFSGVVMILLVVVSVIIIGVGIATRQTTDRLILSVVVPLLPVVLWCVRESLRQNDAATKLDAIKTTIVSTWDAALSGKIDEARSKVGEIQAAIYDGRSRHPLIFNWIHLRFRPEGEETISAMAVKLAAQRERREK
jgi:hypothetical protein